MSSDSKLTDDVGGFVLKEGRVTVLWIDGFGSVWAPVMLGPAGYVLKPWGERC